ncbi:hypothetical protein HDV00_009538 [Rhizophlyctis rosea]|nr:hypothetical protein HDV00_009538 [Rhizophlyctis rosea]
MTTTHTTHHPPPLLTSLPVELQTQILSHLSTTHPRSLHSAILTSRSLFRCGIEQLWHAPRIGPGVRVRVWKEFVKVFERAGPGKGSGVDYKQFVMVVEDVWLFVGGDDAGDESEGEVAKAAEGVGRLSLGEMNKSSGGSGEVGDVGLGKKGRGLKKVPINRTSFPRYSLHHCLALMMERCPNVHTLRLHFHTENMAKLPWAACVGKLQHLELKMRVVDSTLKSIFEGMRKNEDKATSLPPAPLNDTSSAPHMKSLIITWSELTAESMALIAKHCPSLAKISIKLVTPPRPYYNPNIVSASQHPVNDATLICLASLPHLTSFNIWPLPDITTALLKTFATRTPHQTPLTSLTITLSSTTNITLPTILTHLPTFPALQNLTITARTESTTAPIPLLDKTISESAVLKIPKCCPNLKRVCLKHLDFARVGEEGFTTYYGVLGTPWLVDAFRGVFSKMWPDVNLVLEYGGGGGRASGW